MTGQRYTMVQAAADAQLAEETQARLRFEDALAEAELAVEQDPGLSDEARAEAESAFAEARASEERRVAAEAAAAKLNKELEEAKAALRRRSLEIAANSPFSMRQDQLPAAFNDFLFEADAGASSPRTYSP